MLKMRQNQQYLKSKNLGFTLIELLVVIFIIGVLVSLILANILGARQRAEDVQRKNDLQQLQKALRLYYNDYQRYPESDGDAGLTSDVLENSRFVVEDTVYMGQVPDEFEYYVDEDGEAFRLFVALDNLSDKDIEKSQNRCPEVVGLGVENFYDENSPYYVVCEY